MRIGLDVDEVIARLHEPWIERYNREYNDSMTADEITTWEIQNLVKPECGTKIFELLTPDLYDSDAVQPYPDAKRAIAALRTLGHSIAFVTSCGLNNETAGAKFQWLMRHGFFSFAADDKFIPGRDKSRAPVDLLVDDHVHNVETFLGPAILVTRPHNTGIICDNPRVSSLGEMADKLWNMKHPPYVL